MASDTGIKKQRDLGIAFDVLFGIIAPILCLVFDPGVFTPSKDNFWRSLLSGYRVFAYLGIALGVLAFAVWVFSSSRLSKWRGIFAGIFFAGAVFASVIGLVLLPFSVIALGLRVFIGIVGFIPFLTAYVYFSNGLRAIRIKLSQEVNHQKPLWGMVILGILIVVSILTLAQWQTSQIVSQSVKSILNGNPQTSEASVQRLKSAFWCTIECYEDILETYTWEKDKLRRDYLATVYQEITGRDIHTIIQRRSEFQ
jgi:MFS family permease